MIQRELTSILEQHYVLSNQIRTILFCRDLVEFIKELNDKIAQWSPVTTMIDNEYAKVEKLVGGIYYNLVKQNLDLSKEACRKELNKLYARIEEKLEKPSEHYIDIQQFHQDLEQLKAHYQDSDQVHFELSIEKKEFICFFVFFLKTGKRRCERIYVKTVFGREKTKGWRKIELGVTQTPIF